MGNVASEGTPNNFTQILEGDGYRYYMSNSVRKTWADKPSGTYYEPIDVKLIAVTSATGAQVVYTTDGSNPTASSGKRHHHPLDWRIEGCARNEPRRLREHFGGSLFSTLLMQETNDYTAYFCRLFFLFLAKRNYFAKFVAKV